MGRRRLLATAVFTSALPKWRSIYTRMTLLVIHVHQKSMGLTFMGEAAKMLDSFICV
jgi:hypothetical protein